MLCNTIPRHMGEKTFKSSFLGEKVSQNIDPSGNLITNTGTSVV